VLIDSTTWRKLRGGCSLALVGLLASSGCGRPRPVTMPLTFTLHAGVADRRGHEDGPASRARFHGPHSLALAPDGTLYVSESQWPIAAMARSGG